MLVVSKLMQTILVITMTVNIFLRGRAGQKSFFDLLHAIMNRYLYIKIIVMINGPIGAPMGTHGPPRAPPDVGWISGGYQLVML